MRHAFYFGHSSKREPRQRHMDNRASLAAYVHAEVAPLKIVEAFFWYVKEFAEVGCLRVHVRHFYRAVFK